MLEQDLQISHNYNFFVSLYIFVSYSTLLISAYIVVDL